MPASPVNCSYFPTDFGVCALTWTESELTGFRLPPAAGDPSQNPNSPAWIENLIGRVQLHLGGQPQDFSEVCYDFGTVSLFQRRVYLETLAVKPGLTQSYGNIAVALGLPPGGSRAVAAALGANPWPLLIPCHRIIGTNGKMIGFSGPGGIAMKSRLLACEGAQLL